MIAYKYSSFCFLDNILRGTFAFSPPDRLNDPYECAISTLQVRIAQSLEAAREQLSRVEATLPALKTAQLEASEVYRKVVSETPLFNRKPMVRYRIGLMEDYGVNSAYNTHIDRAWKARAAALEKLKQAEASASAATAQIAECNKVIDGERALAHLAERVKRECIILSLSWEQLSSAMWAYYADNHAGICVGVDIQKAWRSVSERIEKISDCELPFGMRNVTYHRRMISPIEDGTDAKIAEQMIRRKARDWMHEREVRLISPTSIAPLHPCGKHLVDIEATAVRSVTFGSRISMADIDLCISRIPHDVAVYRVTLSDEHFKLRLEEIRSSSKSI